MGEVRVMWSILNFDARNYRVSGTDEARVARFFGGVKIGQPNITEWKSRWTLRIAVTSSTWDRECGAFTYLLFWLVRAPALLLNLGPTVDFVYSTCPSPSQAGVEFHRLPPSSVIIALRRGVRDTMRYDTIRYDTIFTCAQKLTRWSA